MSNNIISGMAKLIKDTYGILGYHMTEDKIKEDYKDLLTDIVEKYMIYPKHVDLVMEQTNVSHKYALDALVKNNGDVVNAIMMIVNDENMEQTNQKIDIIDSNEVEKHKQDENNLEEIVNDEFDDFKLTIII